MAPLSWRGRNGSTPQIACKVTVYKVDSAYKVGFCWNQIILGIFIVIIDLILNIYSVACKVGPPPRNDRNSGVGGSRCPIKSIRLKDGNYGIGPLGLKDGNDARFWSALG